MTHVPQLEHVAAFLSKHADGILKDQVYELQSQLVKLRSLPFTFSPCVRTLCLTVCPAITVYDDSSHPPATYLGTQYSYRTADASHNNICDPKMGKADEPYARSVQQTHALQHNILPDAGLVFDTPLKCEKV